MKKNKLISILGVGLSAIALIISVIELFVCIEYNIGVILMAVVIVVMAVVLVANLVNLIHLIKHKKTFDNKGEKNEN